MKAYRESDENMNYDFSLQKQPKKRMGEMEFANLPQSPMMKDFGAHCTYRSGNVNSFTAGIKDLSDISENQK